MNLIEEKLNKFLKSKDLGNKSLETLSIEFADRMRASLLNRFDKDKNVQDKFTLRMSNIGLPLRQLCLQRDYGRSEFTGDFALKSFYGVMLESFMLFLLKASGNSVEAENKLVTLKVGEYKLNGELDLIIDGRIWDVKSASNYAYENKFIDYKTLELDDSFGYMGQLFGYAMAEGKPVGGWIVINKEKGLFKVIEIPLAVQSTYRIKYMEEFAYKIAHVLNGKEAPICEGVIDEVFYKKPTGNRILNSSCGWCSYKDKCHPGVVCLPSLVSEAKDKPNRYYVKIDKKYNV